MEIRTIEPRDFVEVATLENQNWTLKETPHLMAATAEQIMNKVLSGTTYLVAIEDEKIVGVLDYKPRHPSKYGNHVVTFGLVTDEKARQHGIATRLIEKCFECAKNEGFKKVTIQVLGTNKKALQLYKKIGFVQEAQLKNEFLIHGEYVDDDYFAYYLDPQTP